MQFDEVIADLEAQLQDAKAAAKLWKRAAKGWREGYQELAALTCCTNIVKEANLDCDCLAQHCRNRLLIGETNSGRTSITIFDHGLTLSLTSILPEGYSVVLNKNVYPSVYSLPKVLDK
jgi:hypothetical protein